MVSRPFLFGDWRVEPSLNQVVRGSTSRRVTPKAMEVLVVLAAHAERAVTREELLDGVWSDVHVNEEVLTRAIADLRKIFDDDPRTPRYIETIPKRGYRLVAPVTSVSTGDGKPNEKPRAVRSPMRGGLVAAVGLAGLVGLVGLVGMLTWAFRDPGHRRPGPLETRPLTSLPGREVLPALSPDGKSVAFSWQGDGRDNWDVYLKSLDSETVRRMTHDPAVDASAAWSPDGRHIAFERYREGAPCRILDVDVLGGGEREIGSCGESQNPDLTWSPDGSWLAFSDRESPSESFGIYLLSPATGERRKLVAPDGQHWGDKDPAFSPDGKWVSFTRGVSMSTQDVFRIGVSGGAVERVTFDGREVRGHAFAPDGRSLVVSSARNGRLALWRFPLDGGTAEWIALAAGAPRSPAFGLSGALVFEDRTSDSDIVAVGLDGSESERAPSTLVTSTREEEEPAVSPNGDRIAFVSTRSGFPELWMSDVSGESPIRLTDFHGPAVGSPRWSIDGSRIAFDARPDGHADVFWTDATRPGAAPKRVTSDTSNEIAPAFSPDASEVYFGSDRSGTWQIWKSPLDAHSMPTCVTRDGGYAARVSADGRVLYFTKYDRAGLFRLGLPSGDESPVLGTEKLMDASLWDLHATEILFVSSESMTAHLFRLDPAAGSAGPRDLGPVEVQPGGGLSIDESHDRVLFTKTVRTESDLMLATIR